MTDSQPEPSLSAFSGGGGGYGLTLCNMTKSNQKKKICSYQFIEVKNIEFFLVLLVVSRPLR